MWSVKRFFPSFPPTTPPPLLSTVYQCDGCLSPRGRGGLCLVCQVFPAIGAVFILELAANSRSPRVAQAPSLHLATQLLIPAFVYPKGYINLKTTFLLFFMKAIVLKSLYCLIAVPEKPKTWAALAASRALSVEKNTTPVSSSRPVRQSPQVSICLLLLPLVSHQHSILWVQKRNGSLSKCG